MNRYWDKLAEYDREGFHVVVEKSWEDIHPKDLFDDACYDIEDMCRKIDRGDLDWFMLRVRATVDGHELGSSIVGGFLYEDAREVLTDGTAEDLIEQAIDEAKREIPRLMSTLQKITL